MFLRKHADMCTIIITNDGSFWEGKWSAMERAAIFPPSCRKQTYASKEQKQEYEVS